MEDQIVLVQEVVEQVDLAVVEQDQEDLEVDLVVQVLQDQLILVVAVAAVQVVVEQVEQVDLVMQ